MRKMNVFDKPMCCSSGVCGPEVDPALVRFSADLLWLSRQGVEVERLNPAQQPEAFAGSELVRQELEAHGAACLPVVAVDGKAVSRGAYPTRAELAGWAGVPCETLPQLSVMKTGCCEGSGTGDAAGSSCC
ncbi:MAG: arsenite efflux transporter metallochaperone ArsD [Pirellulales bacterium]